MVCFETNEKSKRAIQNVGETTTHITKKYFPKKQRILTTKKRFTSINGHQISANSRLMLVVARDNMKYTSLELRMH